VDIPVVLTFHRHYSAIALPGISDSSNPRCAREAFKVDSFN